MTLNLFKKNTLQVYSCTNARRRLAVEYFTFGIFIIKLSKEIN